MKLAERLRKVAIRDDVWDELDDLRREAVGASYDGDERMEAAAQKAYDLRLAEVWEQYAPESWQNGQCPHYFKPTFNQKDGNLDRPVPWPQGLNLELTRWVLTNQHALLAVPDLLQEARKRLDWWGPNGRMFLSLDGIVLWKSPWGAQQPFRYENGGTLPAWFLLDGFAPQVFSAESYMSNRSIVRDMETWLRKGEDIAENTTSNRTFWGQAEQWVEGWQEKVAEILQSRNQRGEMLKDIPGELVNPKRLQKLSDAPNPYTPFATIEASCGAQVESIPQHNVLATMRFPMGVV